MAKKRKFKRQTESLLLAAQNNAVRKNYINTTVDKTEENSKSRNYALTEMKASIT